jgi:hypothetical protein
MAWPINERKKYGVKKGAKSTTTQLLCIYWVTLDMGAPFFGQFFSMDRYTTKYFTREVNVVWVMSKIDHYLLPRCI